jgi:N-ethylmaleimide reductase
VEGWKKITGAVHKKGGYVFSQLWHTGRVSHVELRGGRQPVTASVNSSYWEDGKNRVFASGAWVTPSPHRAFEIEEIGGIIEDYHRSAERAKAAGFDGVELHAANGYLIDQFCRMGATIGPTLMAVRLRTGHAYCSKW